MLSMNEQAREARARRALAHVGWQGHRLNRSRWRLGSIDNLGGYRIIENSRNLVVAGDQSERRPSSFLQRSAGSIPMTTATVYPPITITEIHNIGDTADSMEDLRSSMANAAAGAGIPELNRALNETDDDGHPGVMAFDRIVDDAAAEIAPQVAALLTEAIRRRLPWTWQPEG